jgi:hypothetical protein
MCLQILLYRVCELYIRKAGNKTTQRHQEKTTLDICIAMRTSESLYRFLCFDKSVTAVVTWPNAKMHRTARYVLFCSGHGHVRVCFCCVVLFYSGHGHVRVCFCCVVLFCSEHGHVRVCFWRVVLFCSGHGHVSVCFCCVVLFCSGHGHVRFAVLCCSVLGMGTLAFVFVVLFCEAESTFRPSSIVKYPL